MFPHTLCVRQAAGASRSLRQNASQREVSRPKGAIEPWPSPHERRRPPPALARLPAAPSDVFVLDFDGVIADSQQEVSRAGYAAAAQHWPELFAGVGAAERARVAAGLRAARPRLGKAYESMVMARLILEDDANVAAILHLDWDAPGGLLQRSLAAWGGRDAATATFERVRATAEGDRAGWLAMNPLYDGLEEAFAACRAPFYIASSKRSDRLVRLLNELLGVGVEEGSPRVMGSLNPPTERKIEALRSIAQRPAARDPATALHFVDDRWETLAAMAEHPDLRQRYNLYLAAWGYNTPAEREAAAAHPGVRLLALPQFGELLRGEYVPCARDGR